MNDVDALIDTLANDAATSPQPMRSPAIQTLRWVAAAAVYVGALLMVQGVRPDLAGKLASPLFGAELMLLLAMIVFAAFSAAALSFPDRYQRRGVIVMPAVLAGSFALVLLLEWRADQPPSPAPAHSYECLACIVFFALLPALWLFRCLRRMATTSAGQAGAVAVFGAYAIGCLTLRLSEPTDSVAHLLTWHYLPMLAFCALGVVIGQRWLKW